MRVLNRKSAGRARVGMVCGAGAGRVRARFLKLLLGGAGLKFAGAGRVSTQNFNPRRTQHATNLLIQTRSVELQA